MGFLDLLTVLYFEGKVTPLVNACTKEEDVTAGVEVEVEQEVRMGVEVEVGIGVEVEV